MCYLGAAKCEKSLGNTVTEVDFLLKSARAFVQANNEIEKLELRSNKKEYIEGALKSYTQALVKLNDESVMKAAIIREIKKVNQNFECTSSFPSPCHRIFELEQSAIECINKKDYVSALEKLTDIFDNVSERKTFQLYLNIMNRTEITRLLLLLVLNLPPGRESPSHIKLLEKYSNNEISKNEFSITHSIQLVLQDLVLMWLEKDRVNFLKSIEKLYEFKSLRREHRLILDELVIIYRA